MTDTEDSQETASGPPSVFDPPETTFETVDGLATERSRLNEAVITPANDPRLDGLGASGILLHGHTGVGKSHLARATIGELGVPFVELSPESITLTDGDQGAHELGSVRDWALKNAQCVVLAEELSVLTPAEPGALDEKERDVSRTVISAFRRMLDAFDDADAPVVFLATSDELATIEKRVRRQGRIDLRLGIERPDASRREAILESELQTVQTRSTTVDLTSERVETVAEVTDGATAAELVELAERAARRAIDKDRTVGSELLIETVNELDIGPENRGSDEDKKRDEGEDGIDFGQFVPKAEQEDNADTEAETSDEETDFTIEREEYHEKIDPQHAVPAVGFDDIGGLVEQKRRLRELVEWPQRYPERFEALDIDTARGIVLHGPPGTGKTLLAKAIANETDRVFLSVSGPELLDKYFGESERLVRKLFEGACELAPTVLFFDEFDAIAGRRGEYAGNKSFVDSIVNQLLSELDGMAGLEDVVVLAATNRLEMIDPAIRRPGRFDEELDVPPPGPEGRREIFAVHLEDRPVSEAVDEGELAARTTDGYTGADIAEICEQAAMTSLRDDLDERSDDAEPDITIETDHLHQAIESVDPTCGEGCGYTDSRAFR